MMIARWPALRWLAVVLIASACAFPAPASAQWAPTKPLRIIVPFPAGGIVDLMARTVSDRLSQSLGQPVVVEARPGGNSIIGADLVAKADPDGHTLLMATLSNAALPGFGPLPFHPTKDFAGVGMLGQVPNLVLVPPALGPKTLKEFIDYAKARPGELNYANSGNGTSPVLGIERLKRNTGIQVTSIGYKGLPPAVPDLISGRIQLALMPIGVAGAHVKSGKLHALALAAPARNAQFPDLPTMAEAGFAESPVISWYGFLAPAATPRPAIERLNQELTKALADPEVVKRIEALGGAPMTVGTPAQMDTFLAREVDFWIRFIKETGLKLD